MIYEYFQLNKSQLIFCLFATSKWLLSIYDYQGKSLLLA